jgi:hypothetical protein
MYLAGTRFKFWLKHKLVVCHSFWRTSSKHLALTLHSTVSKRHGLLDYSSIGWRMRGKAIPVTDRGGPRGQWDVEAPTFFYRSQMMVRLSALRAARPLSTGRFLILISVRGWVGPRAIVWLERLGQLKNPVSSNANAFPGEWEEEGETFHDYSICALPHACWSHYSRVSFSRQPQLSGRAHAAAIKYLTEAPLHFLHFYPSTTRRTAKYEGPPVCTVQAQCFPKLTAE